MAEQVHYFNELITLNNCIRHFHHVGSQIYHFLIIFSLIDRKIHNLLGELEVTPSKLLVD